MTMTMLMLMTMRSSVALRLMEEYLRFFSKRARGECFFLQQTTSETTENRDSNLIVK